MVFVLLAFGDDVGFIVDINIIIKKLKGRKPSFGLPGQKIGDDHTAVGILYMRYYSMELLTDVHANIHNSMSPYIYLLNILVP